MGNGQYNSNLKQTKPMNRIGKVLQAALDAGQLAWGTTLRKFSKKRKPLEAKRARDSRAYFAVYRPCEMQIEGICTGRARCWHEPELRSRGGNAYEPSERMDTCHECHRYAHDHPADAMERGFMKSGHVAITPTPGATPFRADDHTEHQQDTEL